MASSSQNVPPNENQPAHSTITAIRIPADRSLPHIVRLELVKSTSDYHFSLYDFNLLHHSNSDDMRDTHCRSSKILDPKAEDTLTDVDKLYDSMASLEENKTRWTRQEIEHDPRLHAHSYGNGYGILLDVPLAKRTANPHMTFTHASLRYQPNVIEHYWQSREAWRKRAFKRLNAVPREKAELECMTGEYHIMYTLAVGQGYLPNRWSRHGIFGDAFVLKMAGEKNDKGDYYYEDVPQDILHCSLGNQCLEALKCLPPITYTAVVGERGDQPPGMISPGTGLKG